jgi:hypothetical protein
MYALKDRKQNVIDLIYGIGHAALYRISYKLQLNHLYAYGFLQ